MDLLKEIQTAFSQDSVPHLSVSFSLPDVVLSHLLNTVQENYYVCGKLDRLRSKSKIHYYHSLRVGVMHRNLLEMDPELKKEISIYTLDVAGLLHDYGKTCIYDEILEGQELSAVERKIMQAHNRLTSLNLRFLERRFFPNLRAITSPHHPYPRTGGERRVQERRILKLPLEEEEDEREQLRRKNSRRDKDPYLDRASLLLRICDVYDAWASKRSYKEAWATDKIRDSFREHFPEEDSKSIEYLLLNYHPF